MNIRIGFIAFTLCLPLLITAQTAPNKTDAAGKKQGKWIKYDDNHKKIYEGTFKDDAPQGKFIYYYNTGTQRSVTVFSENGKIARAKMYDAGGKITGEGKYINQKRDSIWKFYNEDGKVISDEIYVDGKKNGNCKVYYGSGDLSEEKMWKNGVPDGPVKKYFEGGQLKYSSQNINDKLEGKTTFYFPSGKVETEGVYKGDLKDGEWKYYNEDGTIKRLDKFANGRNLQPDKDYIPKEQMEKAKQQNENLEIKDPFKEGYEPK